MRETGVDGASGVARISGGHRVGYLRLLLLLPVLLVLQFALPSRAHAGADIYLRVNNQTQVPFKLLGNDNYCWYPHQLDQGEAPKINPGESARIYTESKTSFATSCFGADDRWQSLDISFQRADGSFPGPYEGNLRTADAFPYAVNEGAWSLHWPRDPVRLLGIPKGWFPIHTPQSSAASAADGIFCISAYGINDRELGVNVRDGASCTGTGARRSVKPHHLSGKPAPAGPGPSAADNPQIVYDVFQLGRSACELLKPDRPWGASCNEATDGNWDLANLAGTTQVRDPQATTVPTPVAEYKLLGHDSLPNRTEADQSFSVGYTSSQGEEKRSATTSGWKFGANLEFKSELHFIAGGEAGGAIDFEHNWETTNEQTHSKEIQTAKGANFTAKPGGTTYGYVFQRQGSLDFNFSADLSTGTPNTVVPIKTPMTRVLGMSAARQQPCIGYLAGRADPGSLMGLGRLAASRGLSPATPGLPPDQKAFLASVPGFSVSSTDKCPGFPDGYPAAMAFKGNAFVKSDAASGTSWIPSLGDFKYCPYFEPFSQSGKPSTSGPVADPKDPCSGHRPPDTPGTVVNGADAAPGETVNGSDGGNLLLADGQRNLGGTTEYRGGAGNDVLQGRKYSDPMFGGPGADVGIGMDGADQLHGDLGDDSLYGGPGDDALIDPNGNNGLFGGPGDDRLSSSSAADGGLLGGAGNDVLAMHGRASVVLEGGPGDDVYRLKDGARTMGVAEFPGQGNDTIVSTHSLTLPPNVERAAARGSNGISLRAGIGDQTLKGSAGDDTLAGGPGSDRVDGGAGDDQLRLAAFGFDRATGGPGADRFLALNKRPPDPSFPIGVDPGRAASAHVITDLHAKLGDRLVLSTANFGKRLGQLQRHMRITNGRHARGHRPQLVFNPRRHLLSFDRDGRHGAPPSLIAILQGHEHLRAGSIDIVRP